MFYTTVDYSDVHARLPPAASLVLTVCMYVLYDETLLYINFNTFL